MARSGATRPAIASGSHPGRYWRTRESPWPVPWTAARATRVTGRPPGETTIVAGTTITGDSMCRATNAGYRMDTASARAFPGRYVTLP